mgnify:CR=1 FL=1
MNHTTGTSIPFYPIPDEAITQAHWVESGEPGNGHLLLTDAQLAKFDKVPGIKEIYRHGPISIYDLKDLGVPEQRNGWYGETPTVTRSPGTTLMRNRRMRPLSWASTSWPASHCTR